MADLAAELGAPGLEFSVTRSSLERTAPPLQLDR